MDRPGKVANPARGQLNRENDIPLSTWCVPENLVSRDGFSRPVPRQPAHLHTQAESGAYLRDSWNEFGRLRQALVHSQTTNALGRRPRQSSTHTQPFRPMRVVEASMRAGLHDVQEIARLT